MHCSSCGMAVTPSLRYCNRCGAELKAKEHGSTRLIEVPTESLVWAIASVTIIGLGAVIGLMAVMKEVLHFNDGLIIFFTLLSFLTFLGVDSVFVWLLLRSSIVAEEAGGRTQEKVIATRGVGEAKARVLAEPASSITEHTTRTLESADSKHRTG